MEAVVLAGGLGTRLRSVVGEIPKPMAPVGGAPFLSYLLNYWSQQGVDRFVLSVGYHKEQVKDYYGDHFRGCAIRYAEEEAPLGTGGGLYHALEKVESSRFLLLNGDTFFPTDLDTLVKLADTYGPAMVMALADVAPTARYGHVELGNGFQISKFLPRGQTPLSGFINAGVYLVDKGILPAPIASPFSFEDVVLPTIAAKGDLYGLPYDAAFLDIGVPEDYLRAEQLLSKMDYYLSLNMPDSGPDSAPSGATGTGQNGQRHSS